MGHNIVILNEQLKERDPIIFIHGFPLDHSMWKHQVNFFKKDLFMITYDVRGLGRTDADDGQFTIETLVDDLFFILDSMGVTSAALCGLSMGGYIALRAVEKKPELFSSLILFDTKSEADDNNAKIKRAEGIKNINEKGVPEFADKLIPGLFAKKNGVESNADFSDTLKIARGQDALGVKGCLLAMAARTDTTESLKKIKIPSLIFCGKEDSLTPPDVMKGMADKIAGSKFIVVPEAGHMSPLENPEFVNKELKSFLMK
jgi:3-oxoadipate enol-lactonase